MSESFEAFLKNRSFGLSDVINEGEVPDFWEKEQSLEGFMEENPKAIRVKDLGQWALEYCLEIVKHPLAIGLDDIVKGNEVWKIAVACLGKEAAERRLKEAGE